MWPLAILGGVVFFLWKSSQSLPMLAPGAPASLKSGGQYFQAAANQVTQYTNMYSQSQMSLDQWTAYMQGIMAQAQADYAAGRITADDLAQLKYATGQ